LAFFHAASLKSGLPSFGLTLLRYSAKTMRRRQYSFDGGSTRRRTQLQNHDGWKNSLCSMSSSLLPLARSASFACSSITGSQS